MANVVTERRLITVTHHQVEKFATDSGAPCRVAAFNVLIPEPYRSLKRVCTRLYCPDSEGDAFKISLIRSYGTILFSGAVLGTRITASAVTLPNGDPFRFDGLIFQPDQPMQMIIEPIVWNPGPVNLFFEFKCAEPIQ